MMKKQHSYVHQRGEVKESAIKALVTDPLFRSRVERNRKGKGSYLRQEKHRKAGFNQDESPFESVRQNSFKWAFLLNYV